MWLLFYTILLIGFIKFIITIDLLNYCYIIILFNAELCNGSTADSDSACEGSNPSSAAIFNISTN